jgi:hypothetical protein
MVGTTTGRSGRSPALTSRMEIMLGASAALSGRVAAGCESPALGIKAGALTVNVESGWKVLLRCWLGPTCPTWKRWTRIRSHGRGVGVRLSEPRLGSVVFLPAGAGRRARASCWWLGHTLLIFVPAIS